jgi:HEAT repeat protein
LFEKELTNVSVSDNVSDEELRAAKNVMQALLKAIKTVRMYPSNNPLYKKTFEEFLARFNEFMNYREELHLKIGQYHIYYGSEEIYHNPGKNDNLALSFFKDGLRELTFTKELTYEEMEGLLNVITTDFDKDALDDDVVTLLWEKDFQSISYVIDDSYFYDESDYESQALAELEQESTDQEDMERVYDNFIHETEDVKDMFVDPLTDEDLNLILNDLERDSGKKVVKMAGILLEVLCEAGEDEDYRDAVRYFYEVMEYLMTHGEFHDFVKVLAKLRQIVEDDASDNEIKRNAARIISFSVSFKILQLIGHRLDKEQNIDTVDFDEYITFLDKSHIQDLMKILGDLQTIHSRKMIINALVYVGRDEVLSFLKGLNDPRWYVVRNTVHILRKIGDRSVVDHIIRTVKHSDLRVRKEAIKSLGEIGEDKALQTLGKCLEDPDVRMRTAAIHAISHIASSDAKKIIISRISSRWFNKRDFKEKKAFFDALARWNDSDVYDFLVKLIERKALWRGSNYYEKKACAAYGIGLTGNKSALPILEKYKNASNKLLREYSGNSIKRLANG